MRAMPAPVFLFEGGERLLKRQRMVWISRRLAAQLLAVDLPDAELALRLDRGR